jgi:hypothetical protein
MFWSNKIDDLMNHPDTAYTILQGDLYEAEKGLLQLYRNFVSEMLKISLAGVAILGFLQKFIRENGQLHPSTKVLGLMSMSSFAFSSICALIFLYASAEGYRYYIAGHRAKIHPQIDPPVKYLAVRKNILRYCILSKAGSAIFLSLGAIFTVLAIATVLFREELRDMISFSMSFAW